MDSGDRVAVSPVDGTQTGPRLPAVSRRLPGPVVIAGSSAVVFTVVVLAAAAARPLGALLAAVCLFGLAWRWPALLLALALNGFFVYLAVCDLSGQPRATTAYYVVLGAALLLAAFRGRTRLIARVMTRDSVARVWLGAACFLAVWFVVNGLLYRAGGHAAAVILGEFLAVTIPSVLVALTLDRAALRAFLVGVVVLGCAFAVADVVTLVNGSPLVLGRFTPFATVDPITAGLVPAFAAAALVGLDMGEGGRRRLLGALLALLVAAAVVPGSRGPVVTVAVVLAAALACQWRRSGVVIFAAALTGGALAVAIGAWVGSSGYLFQGPGNGALPATRGSASPTTGLTAPPSTIRIRLSWMKDALAAVPDKPLLGHGLVTLPDETLAAHEMGVAGELVYPHNDAVEAVYSLGIVGLVPFLLALVAPILLARRKGPAFPATILFAGAFAEANFSGEIGTDGLLWVAAALLVAAWLDSRSTKLAQRHLGDAG